MKQSTVTGEVIFNQISKLKAELNDIGEGCEMVGDELGKSSIAYRLLDEQYGKKQDEITKLLKQNYYVAMA